MILGLGVDMEKMRTVVDGELGDVCPENGRWWWCKVVMVDFRSSHGSG